MQNSYQTDRARKKNTTYLSLFAFKLARLRVCNEPSSCLGSWKRASPPDTVRDKDVTKICDQCMSLEPTGDKQFTIERNREMKYMLTLNSCGWRRRRRRRRRKSSLLLEKRMPVGTGHSLNWQCTGLSKVKLTKNWHMRNT